MAIGVGTIAKAGLAGLDVYGNYQQYKSSRDEGNGVLKSAASVAVDMAIWAIPVVGPYLGTAKMAIELGAAGFEALEAYGKGAGKHNAKMMSSVYGRQFGGNFVDTQNASTMRQRGLQAMEHSGYNINSVLGNEARTYYRGL